MNMRTIGEFKEHKLRWCFIWECYTLDFPMFYNKSCSKTLSDFDIAKSRSGDWVVDCVICVLSVINLLKNLLC